MYNQKTPQERIEAYEKEFNRGKWEYFMDLTASNCEVYEMRNPLGEIITNRTLYCFYDGPRKGKITEKPWETKEN
jgi:hypothetical protein